MAVIAWEYERQRRNDVKKRAKEEAFRKSVDDLYLQEREVCILVLHQPTLAEFATCITCF